jgi:hypothetical protein
MSLVFFQLKLDFQTTISFCLENNASPRKYVLKKKKQGKGKEVFIKEIHLFLLKSND